MISPIYQLAMTFMLHHLCCIIRW